jgi:hypothetical protein
LDVDVIILAFSRKAPELLAFCGADVKKRRMTDGEFCRAAAKHTMIRTLQFVPDSM